MATARAAGNHRPKTEVRSQPGSQPGSDSRNGSGSDSGNGSKRAPSTNDTMKKEPMSETAGIARQTRDQVVSTIQQGQQISVEAAQSWVQALSTLPIRRVPMLPGFLAFPMQSADAMTRFFFDVAADLLDAQREYVLALIRVFASEEPV